MPAAAQPSPLLRRRAALMTQGRVLRSTLSQELDALTVLARRPSMLQRHLFDFGRMLALRSLAGTLQQLVLPRWLQLARVLLRGWRLWQGLRR